MIILLVLSSLLHAHELSWDWWPTGIQSQSIVGDTLRYNVGIRGLVSSGRYAPFWLQSNQNGDVSSSPYSGNLSAGIYKEAKNEHRWYDYDFGIQLS